MRHSPVIRTILAASVVGILGFVLSYTETAMLGIAGDGHLWNMAFAIGTIWIVDTTFSYWFGNRWWFWPDQSVDQ